MRNKQVKTKQLKGGRHNGQWAVITYDAPSDDPTVQARTENEVTVAICRHTIVADVVAGHFRKLFAMLDHAGVAVDLPDSKEDTAPAAGNTVQVDAALFDNLKQAVEFKRKCDDSTTAISTGAMKDAHNWLASSAANLVGI